MPSRKTSRNGFDYAAPTYADPRYLRGGGAYPTAGHYAGYPAYPYTQPYFGAYQQHPGYSGAYMNNG